MIPNDDPVRLLSMFVEELELTDLYRSYGKIKKSQVSPRQMFKIVVYAAMNRIYSCRDIESACKRDINFMYLLEGKPAPDHATIARFLSLHFSQCSKKTLAEVTGLLKDLGEISGVHLFIDGTKIESAANRYTFVWKKAVTKHQKRLCENIAVLVEDLERITSDYGIQLRMNRSIQAEGSFADVKADMAFRRYTFRGMENVTAQSVILAIAHNVSKYHNKIQAGKTGHHLFGLKEIA